MNKSFYISKLLMLVGRNQIEFIRVVMLPVFLILIDQ